MINLSALRLRACSLAPYFNPIFFNMRIIILKDEQKEFCPTMGVSKDWICYINPDFVNQIGIKLSAIVLIHEAFHLLSDHATRAELFPVPPEHHIFWNIACDCAINAEMVNCGWNIDSIEGTWLPERLPTSPEPGLTAEEYYKIILDNAEQVDANEMVLEGSGVTGAAADWEKDATNNPESGSDPASNDGKSGVSPAKAKIIKQQIAENISRNPGNMPGFLKRWAESYLNPTIPWTTLLAAAIHGTISQKAGMVDFTYSRPSRRSSCYGNIIMPKMVKPTPKVCAIIDTSGSMRKQDLDIALAETRGILDNLGEPIDVYAADTKVHTQQNVYDPADIELIGGGGTDMSYAIEEATKDKTYDITVVITDGYTGWPQIPVENAGHVIAVITTEHKTNTPDWITAIHANI